MTELLEKAINSATRSQMSYSKFITANDAGVTGGHQAGFHLSKTSYPLYFETPGEKGSNKDHYVTIRWQDEFETDSRFIYYGVGTRNEYRLTRFGRGFPFLGPDNVGDLLVLSKYGPDNYEAYVLSSDEDIEGFFSAFGIDASQTGDILPLSQEVSAEVRLEQLINQYVDGIGEAFPPTIEVALNARRIFIEAFDIAANLPIQNPDKSILDWLNTEFVLFKAIENSKYQDFILTPLGTVDNLVTISNTILNRRKSRAGKSLEHHLEEVFNANSVTYTAQARTEGRKKPDFIFPNEESYHNDGFETNRLTFLGAKTTCKDRWRQVINEANKISTKHLFTLQQGISVNQLDEMAEENVTLVVPQAYKRSFPATHRNSLLNLKEFVELVQNRQED